MFRKIMYELEMEYHPVPLDFIYSMCDISPLHQNYTYLPRRAPEQ